MCDVPLLIEAQALEEQDVIAHIAIFGSPDPPMVSVDLHTVILLVIQTVKSQCFNFSYVQISVFYLKKNI